MNIIAERNKKIALNRWNKILSERLKKFNDNSVKYRYLKARIIGYLVGDGCVSIHLEPDNTIHHSVDFYPDDDGMLNAFMDAFFKVYERKPKIRCLGKYYSVRISSKPIVLDLLKIGSFKSLEWQIPEFCFVEEKKEFLRAFYDCEGYVGKNIVAVQSVNKTGLENIGLLLREFDIGAKFYSYKRKNINWNVNYLLHITDKNSIRRFLKYIGFNHSRKQKKLEFIAGVA